MSNETMTPEQALDEVLNLMCGSFGWQGMLDGRGKQRDGDTRLTRLLFTVGDLRRWSAPLLEGGGK